MTPTQLDALDIRGHERVVVRRTSDGLYVQDAGEGPTQKYGPLQTAWMWLPDELTADCLFEDEEIVKVLLKYVVVEVPNG